MMWFVLGVLTGAALMVLWAVEPERRTRWTNC